MGNGFPDKGEIQCEDSADEGCVAYSRINKEVSEAGVSKESIGDLVRETSKI